MTLRRQRELPRGVLSLLLVVLACHPERNPDIAIRRTSPTPQPQPSVSPVPANEPCAKSRDAVRLATELHRKGRLLAAGRMLDRTTPDCNGATVQELRSRILLELDDSPTAQEVIAQQSLSAEPFAKTLRALASARRANNSAVASADYAAAVETAHRLRVEGKCSESLDAAMRAARDHFPAGTALWEASRSADCRGDRAAVAFRSRALIQMPSSVTWSSADGMTTNRLGGAGIALRYATISTSNEVSLQTEWARLTFVEGTGRKSLEPKSLMADSYETDLTEEWTLSSDGQAVYVCNNGLRKFDARNGQILWQDNVPMIPELTGCSPKESRGQGWILDPAPGLGDEVAIATEGGKILRWDQRTGKRLPTMVLPKPFKGLRFQTAETVTHGDSVRFEVYDPSVDAMAIRWFHYPSGRPLFPGGVCPFDTERDYCKPGLDRDHLFVRDKSGAQRWLNLRTQQLVPGPPRPSNLLSRSTSEVFQVTDATGRVAVLWYGDKDETETEAGFSSVVVTAGGAARETRTLELAPGHIKRIRFSPDGTKIVGFGKEKAVVWDVSSGQLVFDRSVRVPRANLGCVDALGSHVALQVDSQVLLVDLNDGSARVITVRQTSGLLCEPTGLRSIFYNYGQGTGSVSTWDWSGRLVAPPIVIPHKELPTVKASLAANRARLGEGGRSISDQLKLCTSEHCEEVPRLFGNRASELVYVLGGKLLVALHLNSGAAFYSPDGHQLLGLITHDNRDGWFYTETSEGSTIQPFLGYGYRGDSRLDFLTGNPDDTMLCLVEDQVYPFELCRDWFEDDGAFRKMLTRLR